MTHEELEGIVAGIGKIVIREDLSMVLEATEARLAVLAARNYWVPAHSRTPKTMCERIREDIRHVKELGCRCRVSPWTAWRILRISGSMACDIQLPQRTMEALLLQEAGLGGGEDAITRSALVEHSGLSEEEVEEFIEDALSQLEPRSGR